MKAIKFFIPSKFFSISVCCCLFLFEIAHAQIVHFNFDNNFNDQIANHDCTYIESGEPTSNLPTFISSSSGGNQILLDTIQGLQINNSLWAEIDTSSSVEIEMTFTVTDVGAGAGNKDLINCQPGANGTGFNIHTTHDLFSDEENYSIIFSYADGGFDQGVPNHIGHDEVNLGTFLVGEEINLKVIIDFENLLFTALVNGRYVNVMLNDYYDWDYIKEYIKNNPWFIGWRFWQENEMAFDDAIFTSTIAYDDVKIYSPRQATDAVVLQTALQAMIGHVNGSNVLSLSDRVNHLTTILLNFDDNFNSVSTEIFDYMNQYEVNNPPLFSDRNPIIPATMIPEAQLLYFLQQSIFDTEYKSSNFSMLEGVVYEASTIFPGPVSASAPRSISATVEINGTHIYMPAARVVEDMNDAKRPTGYYAPPGEIVTINIPPALVGAGLKVMVGAHDSDLVSEGETNRFVRISKTYDLNSTSTQVLSPFGGGLYIKVPEGSSLGWFDISISDAVKSPYYSYLSGRVTPTSEWNTDMNNHFVEWVDIESEEYMMTLPLTHVANTVADPADLMEQWNNIMAGVRYIGGRPANRPRAEYFLIDSRLPAGAFGTGYPQVIGDYEAPFEPTDEHPYYPTYIYNPTFYDSGLEILFHEMGHAVFHPTLVTEVESIVHLLAVHTYNAIYNLPMDSAFKYSSGEKHTMNEAIIDWMIAENFRNGASMDCDPTMEDYVCDELRYQHRSFAKYIEMAKCFGWESVREMNKYFYDNWSVTPDPEDWFEVNPDNMIRGASYGMNVNMAPLMHFWGLIPSASLQAELEALPRSPQLLCKLLEYRDLVPQNQAEFQVWYNQNYPKKDQVHHDRYDYALANYDTESYATAMTNQIDFLIATYFPNYTTAQLKVFLEGPYNTTIGEMSTALNINNLIPLNQPFNIAPFNYNGTERIEILPSLDIVDWVLVQARDANNLTTIVESQACFILKDGTLVNTNGKAGINFVNLTANSDYKIAIYHKGHLGVLTANNIVGGTTTNNLDLTASQNMVEGIQQTKQTGGFFVLHAGDYDNNGIINNQDFNLWTTNSAIVNSYEHYDADLNGVVNNLDYNLWTNNRSKVGELSVQLP